MTSKTSILTRSGRYFDFLNPDPDTIDIKDIAWALSLTGRFSGHTKGFYSVAQHSVLASYQTPELFAFEALMHDAAEAYCGDMSSPLKSICKDYQVIEDKVYKVIAKKFKLPESMSPEVHNADMVMLATERRDLLPYTTYLWSSIKGITPIRDRITILPSDMVYFHFLKRFNDLNKAKEVRENLKD